MKHFIDGDQVVVTKDDFVDLQESPAVFLPLNSETGNMIARYGIKWLPLRTKAGILDLLENGGGEWDGTRPPPFKAW